MHKNIIFSDVTFYEAVTQRSWATFTLTFVTLKFSFASGLSFSEQRPADWLL